MKKRYQFHALYVAGLVLLFSTIFVIEAFAAQSLMYVLDFVDYGGTFRFHDWKIMGLPAYWFMMLLGLGACIYVSYTKRKIYGFGGVRAAAIPIGFLAVSFVGGKLMYILENYESVRQHGLGMDGLSLFGAVFLVPLLAWPLSKAVGCKASILLDYCTPFGLILLACVRGGCFITGCCGAVTMWHEGNPIILPIQLFEVVLDLALLELCRFVEYRYFGKGLMYPTLLVGYGTYRFFLEFLRKSAALEGGLTTGHICALVSVAIGLVWWLVVYRRIKYRL